MRERQYHIPEQHRLAAWIALLLFLGLILWLMYSMKVDGEIDAARSECIAAGMQWIAGDCTK